jgi:Fe-S cluster assembly iron-binding protein IscA
LRTVLVKEKGGESMVTVTDRATQELRNILAEVTTKPGQALRLVARPGSDFGLGLDEEREGDEVVAADGEKILLIAREIADVVGDATIDIQDTGKGHELVISN